MIGVETVEWGLLLCPEDHTAPDEDGSIAPVVNHREVAQPAFGLQESRVGPTVPGRDTPISAGFTRNPS